MTNATNAVTALLHPVVIVMIETAAAHPMAVKDR
jgi:hypothetical protein